MQFICNELSFFPVADSLQQAEERFNKLLIVFKNAREKYNFRHIRLPKNPTTLKITPTHNFYEWLPNLNNRTTRDLILSLFKRPYMDDLSQKDEEEFLKSNYKIIDEGVPTNDEPFGLPVAAIMSLPAISFHSHQFWTNRKINMAKTNGDTSEDVTFFAYNVCLEDDLNSAEITEWADKCLSLSINNIDQLSKYLGFSKYLAEFSEDFVKQLFEWKEIDSKTYQYILLLMRDAEIHPFTGGMGQTENLKYQGKESSKRINQEHRLSYTVSNNKVFFIACKGHYEFH